MSPKVLSAILLALAVLVGSTTAAYVYVVRAPQQPAELPTLVVAVGDSVSVHYIGMFEDGRVFDTSMESVASDDAAYPKALSFQKRESYTPLNFTVGAGQMINGFDQGVRGMHVGQTKTIRVSPEDGYGSPDPTRIIVRPLREQVSVLETTLNASAFQSLYNVSAVPGVRVVHKDWHWNATVYFVDGITTMVTLKNEPSPGEVVRMGSWTFNVRSIDEAAHGGRGIITIDHLLTPEDVGRIGGRDDMGEYRLTEVDLDAGTFTLDYNPEVAGRTLIFRVTVLSITEKS
ncbi:MAG: FKBP-type peptidyl-prolyl cis-trans isomerase [Candidatus Thermoplasmatota archaeon]